MTENVMLEDRVQHTEITNMDSSSKMIHTDEESVTKSNYVNTFESSDDETTGPVFRTKKRLKRFSDSESDVASDKGGDPDVLQPVNSDSEGSNVVLLKSTSKSRIRKVAFSGEDSDTETNEASKPLDSDESSNDEEIKRISKIRTPKSRIRKAVSADEDSDSVQSPVATKNEEQQLRLKNKKNRLKDKFKGLLHARDKEMDTPKELSEDELCETNAANEDSDSDNEQSSIDEIKQKIKERSASLKMSICDPDTSDEESSHNKKSSQSKPRKDQKRTKMISPKPQRMSAKEAMENMQKIRSESNRMLREREVSLPYHRPKALSLQDIMKRRRPAVTSDGKALPLKMNEEQLKQYALSLQQRQKEMMELCKSESEEEEDKKDLEPTIIDNTSDIAEKEITESVPDNMDLGNKSVAETSDILFNINEQDSKVVNPNENGTEKDSISLETSINNDDGLEDKSGDVSSEMQLVYNDSVEDNNVLDIPKGNVEDLNCEDNNKAHVDEAMEVHNNISNIEEYVKKGNIEHKQVHTLDTEVESQLISLHYDSEKTDHIEVNCVTQQDILTEDVTNNIHSDKNVRRKSIENLESDDFPDDDMDMNDFDIDDIDNMIENAEIPKDNVNICTIDSPALIKDIPILNVKPKLTGAPGMVIDLDGSDPVAPKKLTGVELLKERFTFFAKLKTPEEKEREREKRQKPGAQHLKLKQELEDQIAEQRSLEWTKRLESEKQQQKESDAVRGDVSDNEDDIDKIEAKLEENEAGKESSSESEEEEDLLEDDVFIEDKPKKKNPLVADEAEESDVDETEQNKDNDENIDDDGVQGDDNLSEADTSEDNDSSESEDESESKPKKGRILKAFEDSDEEDEIKLDEKETNDANGSETNLKDKLSQSQSYGIMDSQDDVIQLAQIPKQLSSDVFTSQGSTNINSQVNGKALDNSKEEEDMGTQSFSILNTTKNVKDICDPDNLTVIPDDDADKLKGVSGDLDNLTVISETQPYSDENLDAVVGMCSGSFQTQNCIEIPHPSSQTQMSQSQSIGNELLDMCTGKFYDNEFVSQNSDNMYASVDSTQNEAPIDEIPDITQNIDNKENDKQKKEGDILKSVLDELNEPDFVATKPLKFFSDGNKENEPNVKKRFVIESDDETNENTEISIQKKKKKFKKKKLELRALQISDDEDEEEYDDQQEEDYLSEDEDDVGNQNEDERLVEYDSEENEVEVKPVNVKKKKRKATEFFEQEAELTSEDEWVGSGDEDEAGLDRMEREEGDDETFHQGQLQRELGQIHMRDVLDQDKREVRLIQELLFEDGDLGGGGRQRKFRWRNADGEEVTGTIPEEFADTQEEEFESEEQWRKQRHEREMFLRQMKNDEKEDELNVSVNRTTIIKANLCSRTMSNLLEDVNQSKTEQPKPATTTEKKPTKDVPSPVKKPFTMFQQNYHGSLLTRGRGALARLAALATPLAADDDAPRGLLAPSSKRGFVFATLTPDDAEPKVTKRKADNNIGTPRLVKKMKTEEKQNRPKSSLLEFLKS